MQNKTNRQIFFEHIAQTSTKPLGIEISKAEGIYLYAPDGKRYVDLVSGVSVSNVGHCNPAVVKAVQKQAETYMHLMVYGEIIQAPQTQCANLLASVLPSSLNSIYFVNSGSEAIEGALKLAKRVTGRPNIVACKNAYHGGTHGALSILGSEELKYAFRPLLPGVKQIEFNNVDDIEKIDNQTACVVVEPIQAEGGIIMPEDDYLIKLRERCNHTGTLLVFDEVQTGFGRTGKMFAFEHFNVVPDIICFAKGMGGGMPIGAFVSSKEKMSELTFNPSLGHITTFGGHPVSCAAAHAALSVIIEQELHKKAVSKGALFRKLLVHDKIKSIRGLGLMMAIDLEGISIPELMYYAAEHGIIFDPFLFYDNALRIAPPLTITEEQVIDVSGQIIKIIEDFSAK